MMMRRSERAARTRRIAIGVAYLQRAEVLKLHAIADRCGACWVRGSVLAEAAAQGRVPANLLNDPDWVHTHVHMPGARICARAREQAGFGAFHG